MKLSVIIPVYNEKDNLIGILEKVENANIGKIGKEIILVDDFSTDGSRELLKEIARKKRHTLILHNRNLGKGCAIRNGLKKATGEMILIQDSDLEYNPEDYGALIKPVKAGHKVVYGSRFLGERKFSNKGGYFSHSLGNRILTFFTNLMFFSNLTDMETCYKLIKRDVILAILPLKSKKFEFEPEVTAKILKKGFKIIEVPIHYNPRSSKEGKKIKWKDGVQALFTLIRYRFFN